MRIAVTYDNGMIYTHYSRTPAASKPYAPGRNTQPKPERQPAVPAGRPQGMGGKPGPSGNNSCGGGFRK